LFSRQLNGFNFMAEKSKQKVRSSFLAIIVMVVVLGFSAGVVGELWVNGFLLPQISLQGFDDLTKRLDDLTTQKNKDLKQLLSEQDFSINKVVEKIQPSLVTFYNYKKPSELLSSVYLDKEALGSGFVFTSDGWLLTSKQVINDPKKEYVAQIGQEVYQVKKIVADEITDAVFVKIERSNLPVVDLGTRNILNYGQSVLVATDCSGVSRTTINDLYYAPRNDVSDLIRASENFYQYILIKGDFPAIGLGGAVVNLDGKVVGVLISLDGKVLPIDYFSSVMKSAVQKEEISRSYLGVNFIDLELAPNLLVAQKQGALISSDISRRAVIANSPAQKAGLQAGDIIIKVENEEVSKSRTLPELIQDYEPGVTVNLIVNRDGKEVEVKVALEKL
jgi:S1-C subfamily serine protease